MGEMLSNGNGWSVGRLLAWIDGVCVCMWMCVYVGQGIAADKGALMTHTNKLIAVAAMQQEKLIESRHAHLRKTNL
ncbi:unnamed protein product [Toxocara canis]|uniref:Secreted protein n=1 Tax=Toxocara canis TaxID=6265 RepID=A0A183UUQ0_TOXCA|nr:unnamed protein product [Toxocara canis]